MNVPRNLKGVGLAGVIVVGFCAGAAEAQPGIARTPWHVTPVKTRVATCQKIQFSDPTFVNGQPQASYSLSGPGSITPAGRSPIRCDASGPGRTRSCTGSGFARRSWRSCGSWRLHEQLVA